MKDDEQILDAIWPSLASMNCYLLTSLQGTSERSRYKSSPAYETFLMPKVQLLSLYSYMYCHYSFLITQGQVGQYEVTRQGLNNSNLLALLWVRVDILQSRVLTENNLNC